MRVMFTFSATAISAAPLAPILLSRLLRRLTCPVRVALLARGGSVGGVAVVLLTGARGAAADNSIGDAGAAAIAEALKVNKTVTVIHLSSACHAAGARAARGAAGPWAVWPSCCSRARGARRQ